MWTLANPRLQAAIVCLVIAIVYVFIWPGRKDPDRQRPIWRKLVLRWFHSFTWILIGAACLLWSKTWALAALIVYAIFMLATLSDRKAANRP